MDDESTADSTDWYGTSASRLSFVESALRCEVCKRFYQTPMITSCGHTFCSECIHKCLTKPGICPTCRSPDGREKLRKNTAMAVAVEAFIAARPSVLELARAAPGNLQNPTGNGQKRPLEDRPPSSQDTSRTTTLRPRKALKTLPSSGQAPEDPTSADEVECLGSNPATSRQPGGLQGPWSPVANESDLECPFCMLKFPQSTIEAHVNQNHFDGPEQRPRGSGGSFGPLGQNKNQKPAVDQPLAALNYNLMNEAKLRKKLGDMGIRSTGTKLDMSKRYTEWSNLVRANLDSNSPKDGRTLLKALDEWERMQGRGDRSSKPAEKHPVMKNDFDAQAWSATHSNGFQDLVAQARAKLKPPCKEEGGGLPESEPHENDAA